MAKMFPERCPQTIDDRRVPESEKIVFEELCDQLPDEDYRAFFSVHLQATKKPQTAEIDFCLVHRERGILVIEVKGGVVSYSGGQAGSTDRSGQYHPYKVTPEQQVQRAARILASGIGKLSHWGNRKLEVGWLLVFPETEVEQRFESSSLPPELAVYSSDMSSLARKIDEAYQYWNKKESGGIGLNGYECDLVTNYLRPSTRARRRTLRREIESIEEDSIELTPTQRQAMAMLRTRSRTEVCGGAGTGKTLVALEHARWLADSGKKTLLTCFNLLLGEYLAQQVDGHENLTAMAWEPFCRRELRAGGIKFPVDPPGEAPARKLYYEEQMPRALQNAYLETNRLEKYDAILVDEAQDFPLWWLTEVLELSLTGAPGGEALHLFRDPQQGIFRTTEDLPDDFEQIPMIFNERNTREIHEFGSRFNELAADTETANRSGRPVDFIEANNPGELRQQLSRLLHRLVEEENIDAYDIAILAGGNRDRGPLAETDKVGNFKLTKDFFAGGPNDIFFDSIYKFKGLEKPVVILADLGKHLSEDKPRESIIYVGATRAKGHLIVIESADMISMLKE